MADSKYLINSCWIIDSNSKKCKEGFKRSITIRDHNFRCPKNKHIYIFATMKQENALFKLCTRHWLVYVALGVDYSFAYVFMPSA